MSVACPWMAIATEIIVSQGSMAHGKLFGEVSDQNVQGPGMTLTPPSAHLYLRRITGHQHVPVAGQGHVEIEGGGLQLFANFLRRKRGEQRIVEIDFQHFRFV